MIGNKYDSGDYRGVYRAIIEADNRLLPNDVKINYNMEISLLNMHINEFERDIANGKPFNECLGMFQAWISDFKRFAFKPNTRKELDSYQEIYNNWGNEVIEQNEKGSWTIKKGDK